MFIPNFGKIKNISNKRMYETLLLATLNFLRDFIIAAFYALP